MIIPTDTNKTDGIDLNEIQARLAGQSGPRFWRSLEELADTKAFQDYLRREYPNEPVDFTDSANRRTFLKLMGASLALAGVSGCGLQRPPEKIVPYVRLPEEIIPGRPLYYATAITKGGYPIGVVAESHTGRPTMLEGNDKHPDSLGGIDAHTQAAMLGLYDPDRSQTITQRDGTLSTWDKFLVEALAKVDSLRNDKGKGLRILTETVTSPAIAGQLQALLKEFPEAKWHQYEPVNRDQARAGAKLAFGKVVSTQYHLDKADVILSLGADFLANGPAHLRLAREFAGRRETLDGMNRLYVMETLPTITGGMADHRVPVAARRLPLLAQLVAKALGVKLSGTNDVTSVELHSLWANAVARDLTKNKGKCVVIAGEEQPPFVHALAHAMNHELGNVGKTVVYTEPVEADSVDQVESLRSLSRDLDAGAVQMLVILGGNPAYNAPVELEFAAKIEKAPFSVHLSQHDDETSAHTLWHVPQTHELETWGDALASDGTLTIQQPLIAPLYDGLSTLDVITALLRKPGRAGYEIVRESVKAKSAGTKDFEPFWRKAVHDGLVGGTAFAPVEVSYKGGLEVLPAPKDDGLEIVFRPDPTIWDGRYANNGWLQELPKPMTKLTWDNVAMVSAATAQKLGVKLCDYVKLSYQGRKVLAPIWILPGHADDSVTITLGYGRTRVGKTGENVGFNAYHLRTASAPWADGGLEIVKTGRIYDLATTESHRYPETRDRANTEPSEAAEKRHLVRVATIGHYNEHKDFARELEETPPIDDSLFPKITGSFNRMEEEGEAGASTEERGYAWGMAINLNTCIGCSACVTACQAENNIPVVGKDQISRGREMQWIDIDRYYHGGLENPDTYHQPRMCMHCENAPCETVCPVGATVHDNEGINTMVYNRCVGTRYCGNNCPYKVRHFNFYHYTDETPLSLEILNNPDVTVRGRGVMEKCTYCIQRINAARYPAEIAGEKIKDGDIVTACQAACPTRAIVFGDINDPNSKVSKVKADQRSYGMLTELNTRPRTSYVARLRNPNPEIETEQPHGV